MKIRIEKGIPIPPKHKPLAGGFPFADMEVGDSFGLNGRMPQTVGYLAAVFGRRQDPPRKFVVRKTTAGHRCWRVA